MPGYMPPSKNDKWATPKELYNKLNDEFKFNYDPCPINWKPGDADGLQTEWGASSFVNPPYSDTASWIQKAHGEWKKGKQVVMLINAITDTRAFHKFIYNQAELRFLPGRIKFVDYTDPANPKTKAANVKPSMLVIFKQK